ncbi:uncharacterized protein K02A2.6-like, partial [Temnothorax curvispinosus]|uniref:RNA-directed DNA polymerase n=1 Tax=Temnothorax curvispinosus TaxID=300111 RepID=A0A6J1Q6P8_9HYME
METILEGLPGVTNFFDDIIIPADGFDNLLSVLSATLERLRTHGIRLNRAKCVFATPTLECLGHKIDRHGFHKSDKHIAAIRDAPQPTTPEQLQLFLGKATYYSAYISNLSDRTRPLRDMLLTDPFKWTLDAEKAYQDIKEALISPQVLMQYDPSLPLILATDASKTDHKPLTQILHPEKSLPTLCISRMANYADYLAHFNFDVVFKPTDQNTNADYCSRIPHPSTRNEVNKLSLHGGRNVSEEDGIDRFALHQIQQLPVRAEHIARETRKNPHLGKIVQELEAGRNLARIGYKAPEACYTLAANCLLFEHRVVIPSTLRQPILDDLHTAHIGIVKMKGLARSFIYWPGIDSDIERSAKSCVECARHAHAPPKFSDHHWEYPKGPWGRVHIDYAGPVAGAMLLVIVDAYSKWLEVKVTNSSTTEATIKILDELFAAYGVPTTIVSDNGTQFTAAEFKTFLQRSGVTFHKFSAPYHPATNGQAERYVQTVKDTLKAMSTTRNSLQTNLNELL